MLYHESQLRLRIPPFARKVCIVICALICFRNAMKLCLQVAAVFFKYLFGYYGWRLFDSSSRGPAGRMMYEFYYLAAQNFGSVVWAIIWAAILGTLVIN
ncbi:hypothetical protein FRC12_024884 [Ceratobasidium sp. 428]|nr:hypothetical protein FRC12_024884 [Ceratobasidium sp. 428]